MEYGTPIALNPNYQGSHPFRGIKYVDSVHPNGHGVWAAYSDGSDCFFYENSEIQKYEIPADEDDEEVKSGR